LFSALGKAFAQLDDPRVRAVLWKSLAGAVLVFTLLTVGLWFIAGWLVAGYADWLGWLAHAGTLVLALFVAWFLFPVAVTAITGLFLEDVAAAVEDRHYPGRPPPRSQSLRAMLWAGLRFAAVALLLNVALLPVYLVTLFFPPLYFLVFYLVNGYLLGREYFELVAYRRIEERAADEFRRAYRGRLTLAGVVIALILTIPVVNLIAPIVATAFALHLFEAMRRGRPPMHMQT
jgi:CysZ protein